MQDKLYSNSHEKQYTTLSEGVVSTTLQNGAKVLIKNIPDSQVIAVTTYFSVGYFQEEDDESGLAHLMEHMFFKGSKNKPAPEEIGHAIEAMGGMLNAGTIYDRTFYYFVLPKNALQPAIEIMADALINPILDSNELKKEIEVIIEESNRKRDNPDAMASELMLNLAYDVHRIRRWRIGSDDILRAMTQEKIINFHKRLYRPEHVIISIVGACDTEETLDLITKSFSSFEKGFPKKENSPKEPPQKELKIGWESANIQQTYIELAFKTTTATHIDQIALDVLAKILGGSVSSRFHRKLHIETGVARKVDVYSFSYQDVGVFEITLLVEPSKRIQARDALLKEIERIKEHGISHDELKIAVNNIESEQLFKMEEVKQQAVSLAFHEAYGSYKDIDKNFENIKNLSVADINDIIKKYLVTNQATLFYYYPNDTETPNDNLYDVINIIKTFAESAKKEHYSAFHLKIPERDPLPIREKDHGNSHNSNKVNIHKFPLAGGGDLLVVQDTHLPVVSIQAAFLGGRMREPSNMAGLSRISLNSAFVSGTYKILPEDFTSMIDGLGVRIIPRITANTYGYELLTPAKKAGSALDLLLEMVLEPLYDNQRLKREQERHLAEIKLSQDQTNRMALDLVNLAFYGQDHPLGQPLYGNFDFISSVDRESIKEWHKENTSKSSRLFVVVGNLKVEPLVERIEKLTANLPSFHKKFDYKDRHILTEITECVETRKKQQTALAFGFLAPSLTSSDYPAFLVMQEILSGFGGRLGAELRGRQSLAYVVTAFDTKLAKDNMLITFISGEASKEELSRKGMLQELDKLRQFLVSDIELERAKSALIGQRQVLLQTVSARSGDYLLSLSRGLGIEGLTVLYNKIKTVSKNDVFEVAQKYLTLDKYAIGILRGTKK